MGVLGLLGHLLLGWPSGWKTALLTSHLLISWPQSAFRGADGTERNVVRTSQAFGEPAAPYSLPCLLPGMLNGDRACLAMIRGKVGTETWAQGQGRSPEGGGGPEPEQRWREVAVFGEKGGEICKNLCCFPLSRCQP